MKPLMLLGAICIYRLKSFSRKIPTESVRVLTVLQMFYWLIDEHYPWSVITTNSVYMFNLS